MKTPTNAAIKESENRVQKGQSADYCTIPIGRAPGKARSKPGIHLLAAIRSASESVGEGLNDDELTRLLLLDTELPSEAGFTFLSLSGGVVTLSVPHQDLAKGYPEQRWVTPDKENTAREIAEKYELSLCEPPDLPSNFLYPDPEQATAHHHLEFINRRETVVVAHPKYLKVRINRDAPDGTFHAKASRPLALGPELLQDLAALYRG